MKLNSIVSLVSLLICLLSATLPFSSAGQRRHHGNYHRPGFSNWDLDEDFLISNWRRKCSKYNVTQRVRSFIAGGLPAEINKFPYLVGLVMLAPPRVFQCGGSLISESFVLTAAHCLKSSSAGQVYVGSYVYANAASAAFVFNVTKEDFIIHENYDNRYGFQDDIGLIHLPKPVTLSDQVKLIRLPEPFMTQQVLQGEMVTAAGWGRTADNSTEFNRRLFYVTAPVLSHDICKCFYLPGLVNSRMHICIDGSGGRGGCDGDSGGPLVFSYKNQDYVVGITSFGSAGGCEIGHPTVFTRVTNYLSWVSKRIGLSLF